MHLMDGAPPPPERRVTLANWQAAPWNRWSYQHISQLIPTARVWRGEKHSAVLPRRPIALGAVEYQTTAGGSESIASLLERTYTDGFLVLHDGCIVEEEYFNEMQPHTRHLLQSVSKSITGILCGALWQRGLLDPDDRVCDHVPEAVGTSFDGATVRHLLDMTAGTRFSEDYDDPAADVRLYEGAAGWRPAEPHDAADLLEYALALPNARPHGSMFEYRSILTDLLGIIIERACRCRFAEALSDMVWSRLGAENDAEITVDRAGNPMTDGGMSVTLRDLGRFGQMILQHGKVKHEQVVPASWIDDTRHADASAIEAFHRSETAVRYPRGHYRSQWWIPDRELNVLLGSGIHGQSLYVDFTHDVVVVKMSTLPVAFDVDIYADQLRAYAAVAAVVSA